MTISRRGMLLTGAGGLGAVLLGCAPAAPTTSDARPAAPTPTPAGPAPIAALPELERRFGRRIGVYALHTGTGAAVGHRDAERFLMCSTAKSLMAGFVLHLSVGDPGLLDRRVRFGPGDLLDNSPITTRMVSTGMTVAELCAAAITVSDNAAYNLLARETGGPAALTAFVRGLGDPITRADRLEQALNRPAGEQDTSTPAAMTRTLQALAVDALPPPQRDRLMSWLRANTTGAGQIRASVPAGWQVGDKTGSGFAGEKNDVGVLLPPSGAPIVLTVFTVPTNPDDDRGKPAIAAATRAALDALLPSG